MAQFPAFYSRQQAFSEGSGGGPMQAPSSLDQQQGLYNSMVPNKFTANSSLHQFMPSPNAMSATDAPRRLMGGGLLPTANGFGADSYQNKRPFMSPTMNAVA